MVLLNPVKQFDMSTELNGTIDFGSIDEVGTSNFKGGEKTFYAKMFNDGLNKVLKAHLGPGASIGVHTHDDSSEIMFIASGTGTHIFDGKIRRFAAGDVLYCPKGHSHSLVNDSDGEVYFMAVVPVQ